MSPRPPADSAQRAPSAVAIGRDLGGWWLLPICDEPETVPGAGPGDGVGVGDGVAAAAASASREGTAAAASGDSAAERYPSASSFADAVAARERADAPRWVFDGATAVDAALRHGVRIARCHDLGLVGRILATRGDADELALTGGAAALLGASAAAASAPPPPVDVTPLFDLDEQGPARSSVQAGPIAIVERYRRQLTRIAAAPDAARLAMLSAAESSGRLVAAELGAAGVPFDAARHDAVLEQYLGARSYGARPDGLEAAAVVVRDLLGEPRLNLDSPRDVLAALRRAGLDVRSTSAWELREHAHPVIEPLVHYKHLVRIFTANGWAWRDTWVRAGRLRTEYVPGGVVTGRWATSGGGALQLPREIRSAVVADEGWRLVVADAAQLEPRILAAISGDARMAAAGQARDMYQAFVDAGVVPTRQDAKIGLLGAMYGGTRGRSGELLPALRRAYPQALRFAEAAARAGERGGQVVTHLGRHSPWPPADAGAGSDLRAAEEAPVGGSAAVARSWGRFTRNFVVQGTAAEWALAWLARIRQRIVALDAPGRAVVDASLGATPHLVYFLHDEVVVHAPAALADAVAREVEEAAAWAGCTLFPGAPVAFPVSVAVVRGYGEAH